MQTVCPITDKRINERVARLNGLVTALLIAVFFIFNFQIALWALMIDFAIRGFIDSKYSPICRMNIWIANKLSLSPKIINAGPKIFAAQVGLFLTIIALLSTMTNFATICLVASGMLGFFSILESFFGYCVACKLYPLFRKITQ